MQKELTKDIVVQFYKYMEKVYGSKIIYKKDSILMKIIGTILSLFKIVDKEKFMKSFATTILKTIYVPFITGEGDEVELKKQVSCCVHEHIHVQQYTKEKLKFLYNYLSNSRERAIYEAIAYSSNIEMYFYDTGKILDSAMLADKLVLYGCSKEDIAFAKYILDQRTKIIKLDGVVSQPSILAIDWFNGLN